MLSEPNKGGMITGSGPKEPGRMRRGVPLIPTEADTTGKEMPALTLYMNRK